MAISTNLPIRLSTVINEIGLPSNSSLNDCFINANASGFNNSFGNINSNNLQAFRGYIHVTESLTVSPSTIVLGNSSSSANISVTSDSSWTATAIVGSGWFSITPTNGTGNAVVTANYQALTNQNRIGSIEFRINGVLFDTVTVNEID